MKRCAHPGCAAYAERRFCAAHTPTRPNARQRGYTTRWDKLSRHYLATHPYCARCGRPAAHTDHIVPHRGNLDLLYDEGNLQPLCRECHAEKTSRERALPDNPAGQVIVVWGPPGCGKTTYVQAQRMRGDLVVDVDTLVMALGALDWYERTPELVGVVNEVVAHLYRLIHAGAVPMRTWVITTRDLRNEFPNAKILIPPVYEAECVRRLAADPRRQGDLEKWYDLVTVWYDSYGTVLGEGYRQNCTSGDRHPAVICSKTRNSNLTLENKEE